MNFHWISFFIQLHLHRTTGSQAGDVYSRSIQEIHDPWPDSKVHRLYNQTAGSHQCLYDIRPKLDIQYTCDWRPIFDENTAPNQILLKVTLIVER